MAKKPDLVVFDEETQQYDAAIKPYATSASSPVIKPLNTATWRNDGVDRVNKNVGETIMYGKDTSKQY